MKDYLVKCYALADQPDFSKYKEQVKTKPVLNEEQLRIYNEVHDHLMLGEMLSDMMWGFWAIIVSKNPDINFDYISFAGVRHRHYQLLKQQYLSKHK